MGVPVVYVFVHHWWCVSLCWSRCADYSPLKKAYPLTVRCWKKMYWFCSLNFTTFFFLLAYFSSFMCEQSKDQFLATSTSCVLPHIYLWDWCWNRFELKEQKWCVCFCVCVCVRESVCVVVVACNAPVTHYWIKLTIKSGEEEERGFCSNEELWDNITEAGSSSL